MRKTLRTIAGATLVALSIQPSALAATLPAPGYIYTRDVLAQLTEGCVAHAPGGDYVGVGPALSYPATGATRSIVFVSESGSVRTVATGLNSISDCVYDVASDILYVTDSGLEFTGATTGDTVFAIPGNSMAVAVAGLELVPSGTFSYAFGIDLFGDGLLVGDAAGGGAGKVFKVDLSGMAPVTSIFASGFDYTGGLIVDGSRVLVSESLASFQNAIYDYSTAGVLQGTVSGPTYDHGSVDVAMTSDGGIAVSGSPTLVSVGDGGVVTPLVTGLDGGTGFDAYGGAISVQSFTGRIDFLASSFSGADDDKSIHHLVPIDLLLAGKGDATTDCAMEFYGVELAARSEGHPARDAICVDGAPCDADGTVDGGCTFPLGLCFNVNDPRLPECTDTHVAAAAIQRVTPKDTGIQDLIDAANAVLPSAASTCVFGDGIRIPLRNGGTHDGRGRVRVRATLDGNAGVDTDAVKLVCKPSL